MIGKTVLGIICFASIFTQTFAGYVQEVCNASADITSYCACQLADLTVANNITQCFSDYVCEYDASQNHFCNGHGKWSVVLFD